MKRVLAAIAGGCITLMALPALAEGNMGQGMSGSSMEKPVKHKDKAKAKKHTEKKMGAGGMADDKMGKDNAMSKDKMAK